VAISPRLFDTVSGDLFNGFGSLSADGDPLALLRFHYNLVYQNKATHNPAILTPFGPSRGSFQTGRSPTTTRLALKRVPRMGFPPSVPHVAPLDSPIGDRDRRCRVFSDWNGPSTLPCMTSMHDRRRWPPRTCARHHHRRRVFLSLPFVPS